MPFADLVSEVAGVLPGAPPLLVEKWVARSWRNIRDKRVWGFLETDDAIVCPTQITAGTINVLQFSNTVTADATASAALLPIITLIQVAPQFMSFRFGGLGATSQIYNIVSFDQTNPAAVVFTLDRAVVEPTNPTSGYQCYRPYVAAPVSNFLRWITFVDMVNGWSMNLDWTSAYFDQVDPQRQSFGQAYNVGYYKASSDLAPQSVVPIYELWPHPTDGQTFYVRTRSQGDDFIQPGDTQPQIISDQLIVQWALAKHAYPWARVNAGRFPALAKVNWSEAIRQANEEVHGIPGVKVGLLQDSIRQDDNQSVQSVLRRGHGLRQMSGFPYPIDANFIQSHLVQLR